MAFLVASLAVLLIGPLTYGLAQRAPRLLKALDALVVASVGALIVIHILPETVERTGWIAVVPLVVGLLGPTLLERALSSLERQAHTVLLVLVLLGLGLHAVMDGVAIVLPHEEEGLLGMSLPLAVVLHRIPVSLLIWWLLRPTWGVLGAAIVLSIEGLGTIVGYVGAEYFVAQLQSPVIGAVQAFVAGSMLHVLVDRRDYGGEHAH